MRVVGDKCVKADLHGSKRYGSFRFLYSECRRVVVDQTSLRRHDSCRSYFVS